MGNKCEYFISDPQDRYGAFLNVSKKACIHCLKVMTLNSNRMRI